VTQLNKSAVQWPIPDFHR